MANRKQAYHIGIVHQDCKHQKEYTLMSDWKKENADYVL